MTYLIHHTDDKPTEVSVADAERVIAERHAARVQARRVQAHCHRLEEPLDALDRICRTLSLIALNTAGYHQHHRGEWRKRREQS